MKLIRKAGDTSNILQIFIQDSSSTTGAGLTGLVFNSGSLTAYYHKDTDTTATAISLVTMTVGTFTSSGFKEIDATNMPGWYQFCPPDAALSTSGTPKMVGFHLKGATNMAPLAIEVQLVSFDLQTATQKVDVDTIKTNPVVNAGTVTFPTSATLASTTNITGGTLTTVTTATNLTTNNDKTGYALTAGERTSVADALLDRDMALGADNGSASGTTGRTVRQALRILRNKWSISAGTQTITKEDDATTSWAQVVTGTAGANPVTAVDPT